MSLWRLKPIHHRDDVSQYKTALKLEMNSKSAFLDQETTMTQYHFAFRCLLLPIFVHENDLIRG